ncbi:MAG: DUF1499 domain-containing protein, partial [Prochlorothrix sp.]|nr:DUF1499 domain-containing protein [Prochlorothrix sp.]
MLLKLTGTRPTNLGVKGGKLAPCPPSPNCVSSQADPADGVHYIAPIALGSTKPGQAIAKLKTIIESLPRTAIIEANGSYLYAEFTSQLLGYVDDVEFYVDGKAKVVQVRSASRLGQSDLGVNRQRIEQIRSKFSG